MAHQAHYDIFRDQLAIRYPGLGLALWEPSPGDLYGVVKIGDVGYISQGRFQRLFNILLPADHLSHENFGVPEHHKPFKPNVEKHIIPGTLCPDNFCSVGVTLESDGLEQFATRPRDPGEVEVSFSCRRKQGAVLSLPIQAKSDNTIVRKDFGKWMIKHIDEWFAWIRRKGLEIDRMEDIVLVTGTTCARSWANVAFLGGQADARVSFGVDVARSRIRWQFSSERKAGAAWNWGPSGENLPEDQCIFIRGFRVARKRILWWPKLKAAAGPNPDLKDDDREPDAERISITKYRDPLHVILEYIVEERPNCDMAIIHDDDLALLDLLGDSASLKEGFQPDVVLNRLRSSKLVVHEVVLGPDKSSVNNVANANTGIVKVASLSPNFERQFLRFPDSETGSMITTRSLVTSELPIACAISSPLHPPSPSAHFKQILDAAVGEYKKMTGNDLLDSRLANELQSCDSAEAVLDIIQGQAKAFDKSWNGDKSLMRWIGSSVHTLYMISATLGEGNGIVLSSAHVIFAGIGVLLAATKDVWASHDALVDLFERIQFFLKRLGVNTQISPTKDMVEMLVKIVVEVLTILSIATKELQQSRTKTHAKKLIGRTDIERALTRLDGLTQEVRIAIVEALNGFKSNAKKATKAMQQIPNNMREINRMV